MTKTEKNYKMMIAGKERIIPEVILTESRSGNGTFVLTNSEHKKISLHVFYNEIMNEKTITLEELEFLRNLSESTANEVLRGLPNHITINYLKNHIGDLTETEVNTIKTFFLNKINKLKI